MCENLYSVANTVNPRSGYLVQLCEKHKRYHPRESARHVAEAAFLEKWKFSAGFEKGAPWPKALPVNVNGAHYTACCGCCARHVSA
jgi:hypothetical protein